MQLPILIEKKLAETTGLSARSFGSGVIENVIQIRMAARGIADAACYCQCVLTSIPEWEAFIDALVIPETWFFRNTKAFLFLKEHVRSIWLKEPNTILRILSFPCSTGEEAYSIAMTILDAGMPPDRFQIDACDLSKKALQKAISGLYGSESFRDTNALSYQDRYFDRKETGFAVKDTLRQVIRFSPGNLMDMEALCKLMPYDIIFCRNLLIYLTDSAKRHVVRTLKGLLNEEGLLFVGHAERRSLTDPGLVWIPQHAVFACKKNVKSEFPPLSEPKFERRNRSSVENVSRHPSAGEDRQELCVDRRKTPGESVRLMNRARLLADQANFNEALIICNKVLAADKTNIHAYFLKGLIYQAMNQLHLAETWYNKTLYLKPDHYESLRYLSLIAEHRGEPEKVKQIRYRLERIQQKRNDPDSGP